MEHNDKAEYVQIVVADLKLAAQLNYTRTPRTCQMFSGRLPFHGSLLQARWSGEAAWTPLGDFDLGVTNENATSTPKPGEILFYPFGVSECEILIPYGQCAFASKFGPLAGSPFMTVIPEDLGKLQALGELVLFKGRQAISFLPG